MAPKQVVFSEKGLKSPLLSQAIIHNGTVYVSGHIGLDTATNQVVEGSVADRTRKALENIKIVLEEAGSSLEKILKMNIYITSMQDYAAMNQACASHPFADLPHSTPLTQKQSSRSFQNQDLHGPASLLQSYHSRQM
ncbi:hypothetical protein LTR84_004405 [Exophiala bonariae]|uniref:Uncharacterized protein n=1 Tax=Exophiala bonariae TaxID=1690606 RepID=A0AAV9N7G9_9EURO|nr:hypothetical protein LTR84_004405 [Exophiala bonariae]